MYLDYSKLEFDRDGIPEVPELMLKTLGGKTIGTIPGVHNLKFNIKFSEPSEISFDVPAKLDGMDNPLYAALSGHKQIYTKHYGIYETMNPTTEADGISDIKHVKGYSYEKSLENKKFFLEEGTFNFWNPVSPADTILGRVLETAIGWRVGYVSPSLIGRYRTFDGYDDYLLSFLYHHAPESFRCVFVFDTYGKTINAYDADEERPTLPIYLDFDNLLETASIEELSEELATAIRPYGADGLDIRDVNPTGTGWLYDLSHFIANGDIGEPLAGKWNAWQRSVLARQAHYKGLNELRASATARLLAAQATLTDLRGQLDTLTAQQSVTIQAQAMEKTDAGKAYQQQLLQEINDKIAAKKGEISAQESTVSAIRQELDPQDPNSYAAQIQAIVRELSLTNFFTQEEYEELSHFFIEQDLTESTFVATDVDTAISGSSSPLSNELVTVSGSSITEVDMTANTQKKLYTMSGGTFAIAGNLAISGDVIRGTMEVSGDGGYVLSLYAGTLRANGKTAPSGMVTISGTMDGFSSDITATGGGAEPTAREGSALRFTAQSGVMYLTANVSDYQRYCVKMELYDYAVSVLDELATPTYEFSVGSGNFLFAQEFAPFRDSLELGKGVYLNIGGGKAITPYIIECELDFEDRSKFSLVFSNRFKRHDCVNTLKDMVESGYSASRSLDASKYIYNKTVSQASRVSEFMAGSLDAATNTILGAANQSVVINGAGIHVGGNSKYQMRIVDSMIALTDDGWQTSKLAIGHFADPKVGDYFGVNADIIGGKLMIGNNLIIENPTDDGVMQFMVDSTGAWLNNSTFVLQKDGGGKILLDPKYGIVAGTKDLFDTDGTTVRPSFVDKNGMIVLDKDGMPVNSNFFLDLRDGSAYFRGNVYAEDGVFNGTVYATGGEFDGIVKARDFLLPSGESMKSVLNDKGKIDSDWLDLYGINVKNKAGNTVMTIDENGVRFGTGYSPIKYQFSTSASGPWHTEMETNDKYRRESFDGGTTWGSPFQFRGTDGANGSDANVTRNNIARAMLNAQTEDGLYAETINGKTCLLIRAEAIQAGDITGVNMRGGAFYNTKGTARLEISNSSLADMTLYGGGGAAVFSVYDGAGYAAFSSYGTQFLTINQDMTATPVGVWDFTSTNVIGLHATFA